MINAQHYLLINGMHLGHGHWCDGSVTVTLLNLNSASASDMISYPILVWPLLGRSLLMVVGSFSSDHLVAICKEQNISMLIPA